MLLGDSAKLRRENVNPKDIIDDIPYIGLEHISPENLQLQNVGSSRDVTSTKQKFNAGDILFGKLRPYFRKVVRPKFSGVCSTDIWVIESRKEVDQSFLYYWLASWNFVNFVDVAAEGTRMPRAKWEVAQMHEIENFTFSEQKAIAHILGTLDDKIELNHKMNQTLQEIAKAIFKSWFVDFDPVRAKAEGRPTGLPPEISVLFPEELVDTEIGEIPKGWETAALSELAHVTMGQSPPGSTYNDEEVGLPFYQGSTDFGFRFPSIRKFCSEPNRLAEKDDVLLSVRAPVGDLNRALTHCCIGRGLASIRSKTGLSSWIFYRCSFFKDHFDTFNSEGTVFGSVNGTDLRGIKTPVANSEILNRFEKIVSPMDESIRVRSEEIEVLSELRDTLLPKLISGELRIPDAEKFLEEAGI